MISCVDKHTHTQEAQPLSVNANLASFAISHVTLPVKPLVATYAHHVQAANAANVGHFGFRNRISPLVTHEAYPVPYLP